MTRGFASRASISGHTRLVVILAHPVGHVRTPSALNSHFAAIGRDAVLVPMQVRPAALAAVVAEVVMQPEVTAFLQAASARGCATHPGLPMLTAQVPLLAEFVTGES